MAWPHATLQFGGRFDHAGYSPEGGLRPRNFNNVSFSLGSLFRPTEKSTLAVSFARAARNPALEELYFYGLHAGNFSFEIGNENLDSEVAYGLDVSYRARLSRVSAEVTYFNNTIDNYIFRSPVDEAEFEDAVRRRRGRPATRRCQDEALPIIEFLGRDARLQGVEAHADVDVTAGLHLELGVDTVHGSLRDSGEPLPRIPPVRFIGGLQYHRDALQVGAQVVSALEQDRVYGSETTTRRVHDAAAVRRVLAAGGPAAAHVLGTIRQRDRRAVPQSPVAREGPRARDGPQFPGGVEREVLDRTGQELRTPRNGQASGRPRSASCAPVRPVVLLPTAVLFHSGSAMPRWWFSYRAMMKSASESRFR